MKRQGWFFLINLLLIVTTQIHAASYTTPQEFMNLYFDFTGTNEPDFPKDKKTIPQYLIQSEKTQADKPLFNGPLILILNSSIYIYDQISNYCIQNYCAPIDRLAFLN